MERVEIDGTVKAVTPKAALICAATFERWFPPEVLPGGWWSACPW